jgi:hypothetical protein
MATESANVQSVLHKLQPCSYVCQNNLVFPVNWIFISSAVTYRAENKNG